MSKQLDFLQILTEEKYFCYHLCECIVCVGKRVVIARIQEILVDQNNKEN